MSSREEELQQHMEQLPLGLRRWLETATDELGILARMRIIEDVEAHYARVYVQSEARGLPEYLCIRKSLEVLGDPGVANKQLAKTNLTQKDEKAFAEAFIGAKFKED